MASSGRPPSGTAPGSMAVLLVGSSGLRDPLSASAPEETALRVTEAASGGDAYQWLTAQPGRVDCIVCANELPDMSGIALLETVRRAAPDVPFVLVAENGDEALASRAVSAGVTEYVPVDGDYSSIDFDEFYERVHGAVADARSRRVLRRRARQFDGVLEDDERYVWVLEPDGTVREASRAAADAVDGDDGWTLEETAFWDHDWWADAADARREIRNGVRAALEGETTRLELAVSAAGLDASVLDLSFRPVRDPNGVVESVIVGGFDVSERAKLARELRESEELHRVTLNNMTDTVLVTDDGGEFTYVCPNVHFIFGYTAAEIRELGSIDALLGADFFDREELASEGVLTNVETTATDKAGREHTLLVNVREVSIQGGTLLFSCRDVTKRKERERALTALHRTSRDLLYAETAGEIASQVATDATDVLDGPGSAVYLFEGDENALRPAAVSAELEALHGPLSPIDPRAESIVGHAFVEQTATTYDDVHDSPRLHDPATGVRSAVVIPLGDHGVFVVASGEVDSFDEITEEIADLVAATAEAALDRVERETKLRDRDRELQRQNRQLERLNRTNEIIRDVDQLLVGADSREEIERGVCERLTADDRFELAWIGAVEDDAVEPRAWAGTAHGYLDAVDLELSGSGSEPATRTADGLEPTVVANVGEDLQASDWRRAALSRGYQSVASVPLEHDDFSFGVLTVYATRPDVFDETTRAVLYELGETIASAIRAVERKTALLDDTVTELEYRIADRRCVLYALAADADRTVTLKGGTHPSPEGTRVVVGVEDGSVEAVVRAAEGMVAIGNVRPIATGESDGLLAVTITTPFVGTELSDHGAALRSFTAGPDEATMTVDVPRTIDTREIADLLADRYPESTLVAQRDRERSVTTDREFQAAFLETVTDRQLEVVETAYFSGYFDSPRTNSGEDVAETLDISSAAFYDHVRKVQAALFATLFERIGPDPAARG